MWGCSIRSLLAAVAGVLLLAIAPAAADADSLVFVKGGHVYVANSNGSNARAISPQSPWWAWPSESDNGTIAVAGGGQRVNPGGATESSGSSEIYAFDQQGHALLSAPVNTPGSFSSPASPTYVDHFRVSPDGRTVAYDVIGCCGASGESTFTSPLRSGASWSQYFDDYIDPEWVDGSAVVQASSALELTHNGPTISSSQPEYAVFDAGNSNRNLGWSADPAVPDGWAYEATLTRSTATIALFIDDAPDTGGTAQNVRIHLESVQSDLSTTDDCTITLPASQYSQPHNLTQASPSFSTDGGILAWAQADGIYEANVSNPSDCSTIQGSIRRVVVGGAMPSFGAASLKPPAPPSTKITKLATNQQRRSAKLTFAGSGLQPLGFQCKLDAGAWRRCSSPQNYKHLKPGFHVFRARAIDGLGHADPTPASKRFKIKR